MDAARDLVLAGAGGLQSPQSPRRDIGAQRGGSPDVYATPSADRPSGALTSPTADSRAYRNKTMFTTIVTDRGEHRPGYYKEVKRCYGTQASLLDRRSADSEDGIWVEEGVYPSHPSLDGRVFVNMHFPITVLTVDDFEAVRRGGAPLRGMAATLRGCGRRCFRGRAPPSPTGRAWGNPPCSNLGAGG